MNRLNGNDVFFDKQPPLSFLSDLTTPLHAAPPARFGRTVPREGEVYAGGLYLCDEFPDRIGALETARADFLRFSEVSGILGDRYPIRLKKAKTPCFEAYLIEADGRLGYHSEAEGYKFFPEKIAWRIDSLRHLLATEFPDVEARISAGLSPLAYYDGEEEGCLSRITVGGEAQGIGDSGTHFTVIETEDEIGFEITAAGETVTVVPEFRLFRITPPVRICFADGGAHLEGAEWSEHWPFYGERAVSELAKWRLSSLPSVGGKPRVRLSIRKADAGLRGRAPFKLRMMSDGIDWERDENKTETLGKMLHAPGCFGWVLF